MCSTVIRHHRVMFQLYLVAKKLWPTIEKYTKLGLPRQDLILPFNFFWNFALEITFRMSISSWVWDWQFWYWMKQKVKSSCLDIMWTRITQNYRSLKPCKQAIWDLPCILDDIPIQNFKNKSVLLRKKTLQTSWYVDYYFLVF